MTAEAVKLSREVRCALIVLPHLSVVAHLGAAHYAYGYPFYLANLAPLFLGAAVVWIQHAPPWCSPRMTRLGSAGLCLAAVLASIRFPDALIVSVFPASNVLTSPLRVMLLSAALFYGYVWWRHDSRWLLLAAIWFAVLSVAGHTPSTIRDELQRAYNALVVALKGFVPSNMMQWGMAAVIAAFVLLAIGAMISLGRSDENGA